MNYGSILIVEDDKDFGESLSEMLSQSGYTITLASNTTQALTHLKDNFPALVISDIQMSGKDGFWLLKQISGSVPVVLMTAFATIDRTISAMRSGAKDFICKPFNKSEIIQLIENHKRVTTSSDIIHESESMKAIILECEKISTINVPVMILGESGTGKDVLANHIHESSKRTGEFVAVNCAAIPENMLESVLFGYEKGAFTGAYKSYNGKFLQSDGGTLFLDEIGEMPLELQAKILRATENKEIDVIGGTKPIPVNLRIITATNADINSMISSNKFREDLYYRLNVIEIKIPPLRDRKDDIMALAIKFLIEFSTEYDKKLTFSKAALEKLMNYPWPGNIRELKNIIQRACIVSSNTIEPCDVRVKIITHTIESALEQANGNRKDAALLLGMSIRTLQYKIKDLKIKSQKAL